MNKALPGHGTVVWWGFSPALDLIECFERGTTIQGTMGLLTVKCSVFGRWWERALEHAGGGVGGGTACVANV